MVRVGFGCADSLFGFDGILEDSSGRTWCWPLCFYPGEDGILLYDNIKRDIKVFTYDGHFKKVIGHVWPDTTRSFLPRWNTVDLIEHGGMVYVLIYFGFRIISPEFTAYRVLVYSYDTGELVEYHLVPDSIVERMGKISEAYADYLKRAERYQHSSPFRYETNDPCRLRPEPYGIGLVDNYSSLKTTYLLIPKPGLDISEEERWRAGASFGRERIRWRRPEGIEIMDAAGNVLRSTEEGSVAAASLDGRFFRGPGYTIFTADFEQVGTFDTKAAYLKFGKEYPCGRYPFSTCQGGIQYRFGLDYCLYTLRPCEDIIIFCWCP